MHTDDHHQSSPDREGSECSNSRLRSRTSTTTTTTTSTNGPPKSDHPTSALPSPATPVLPKPKPQRAGQKKSSKAAGRRSSLNSKKDKKKPEPPSPPVPLPQPDPAIDETNITRCVCGEDNEEANDVIMFQCDKCAVWQHGPCVGLYVEFPGDYFCEKCRPDLHTTGQYQKSSPQHRARRSPSFTSSTAPTTTRRDRVTTDAASLAAFLTDAGVKPEDQLSLGGFALPIFAQTRRQSNMLVDGATPAAKRTSGGAQTSPSVAEPDMGQLPDPARTKRKRPSEEPLEPTVSIIEPEPAGEEKTKRARISPVGELPSPSVSVATEPRKQQQQPSATGAPTPAAGPSAKPKRARKVEESEEGTTTTGKGKNGGAFGGKVPSQLTSTSLGRRGSPMKRSKDDSRRPKQSHSTTEREPTPSEGWGLPDHLAYLDYLLPSTNPQPIMLLNGKMEPATKIKFPGKRSTLADLRKRSKHLVEYLQKVQIESCEREKRNELIVKSLTSGSCNDDQQQEEKKDNQVGGSVKDESVGGEGVVGIGRSVVSLETLKIMDDLSRELYHWQEKYKQN